MNLFYLDIYLRVVLHLKVSIKLIYLFTLIYEDTYDKLYNSLLLYFPTFLFCNICLYSTSFSEHYYLLYKIF